MPTDNNDKNNEWRWRWTHCKIETDTAGSEKRPECECAIEWNAASQQRDSSVNKKQPTDQNRFLVRLEMPNTTLQYIKFHLPRKHVHICKYLIQRKSMSVFLRMQNVCVIIVGLSREIELNVF